MYRSAYRHIKDTCFHRERERERWHEAITTPGGLQVKDLNDEFRDVTGRIGRRVRSYDGYCIWGHSLRHFSPSNPPLLLRSLWEDEIWAFWREMESALFVYCPFFGGNLIVFKSSWRHGGLWNSSFSRWTDESSFPAGQKRTKRFSIRAQWRPARYLQRLDRIYIGPI